MKLFTPTSGLAIKKIQCIPEMSRHLDDEPIPLPSLELALGAVFPLALEHIEQYPFTNV